MSDQKPVLKGPAEQVKVYDVVGQEAAGGRRPRRSKRAAAAVGGAGMSVAMVAIGLLLVPGAPTMAGPPSASSSLEFNLSCQVKELPRPPGYPREAYVTGGDPTGTLTIGRFYPGSGKDRLAIWQGENVWTIPMPGDDAQFNDITTKGVAVGTSFVDDVQTPWIYREGYMTRLAGEDATADVVNEKLTIGGVMAYQPVVWRTPTSNPEPLPSPPGEWSLAQVTGINEEGVIVGHMATSGGKVRRLLGDPDGTVRVLPTPVGFENAQSVWPTAIRGDWVGGRLMDGKHYLFNVRWNLRTGETVASREPRQAR